MAMLLAGTASGQSRPDDWQFRGTIYAYLPAIGGSTTFPAGTGSSISVDADTIISNLKFTFMGSLEAQKGRWGAFTDIIYVDVGGSKSGTRDLTIGGVQLPAGVSANASLDFKATVWTLAGNYRVLATPEAGFDMFAGARLLSLKEKLGWEFSANVGPVVGPGQTGGSEAKLDNWDAIVGVKGRLNFGSRREWFVPYYVDVGAGDSDFTWQGSAGIGYAFNWGEVIAAYRYLDYNFKSGRKIESVNLSGPLVGVAFRW
ncbi:MAG TPA: hypothetical protein VF014_14765 [Casimicrobiaceae bacterium]|nr:hypothetical protein [Casimicrobiaceae bacterium]